ncbi:MAG: DUF177 domain-containing protein [Rhizomicrobium sp.]|jgi:hypothetical protein
MNAHSPLQRIFDLGSLSDAGFETTVVASPAELAQLAEWEAVQVVNCLEGQVTLTRLSQTRFRYNAELTAEVIQNCVVTLDPLTTSISRSFSRTLHYVPARAGERVAEVSLAAADDEAPEEIESLRFDLAGPLLEEFSLAIDPYPRSPGAEFEPPADKTNADGGPFAALQRLKRG